MKLGKAEITHNNLSTCLKCNGEIEEKTIRIRQYRDDTTTAFYHVDCYISFIEEKIRKDVSIAEDNKDRVI